MVSVSKFVLSLVIETFGPKPLKKGVEGWKGVVSLADFWKQLTFELFSKNKKFGECVLINLLFGPIFTDVWALN